MQGTPAGAALAAPEVEGVAQAEAGVAVPVAAAAQRAGAVQVVVRPVLAIEARAGAQLRRLGGAGYAGQGHGLADARLGFVQARAVLEGAGDPGIQLWVVVLLPPALPRPAGLVPRLAQGGVAGQGVGIQTGLLGGNAAGAEAAGQGDGDDNEETDQSQARFETGRHRGESWERRGNAGGNQPGHCRKALCDG
ncbi:hypothetical protein D3C75_877270 [compost metagenome]